MSHNSLVYARQILPIRKFLKFLKIVEIERWRLVQRHSLIFPYCVLKHWNIWWKYSKFFIRFVSFFPRMLLVCFCLPFVCFAMPLVCARMSLFRSRMLLVCSFVGFCLFFQVSSIYMQSHPLDISMNNQIKLYQCKSCCWDKDPLNIKKDCSLELLPFADLRVK